MNGMSELYDAIAEWCISKGADQINQLPGCWQHEWSFQGKPASVSMNGHTDEAKNDDGISVPPFSAVIVINGWPAVVCGPSGGAILGGDPDTEADLIAALKTDVAA